MAVRIATSNPRGLLDSINSAIADGSIKTWSVDADGDFTHTPDQWRLKAWLRPTLGNGILRLNIIAPRGTELSALTYAVYHGRFIEMVLNHFDRQFSEASASALPEPGDIIKPPA